MLKGKFSEKSKLSVQHDGERSLRVGCMKDVALTHDLARPEDSIKILRYSLRFFQELADWFQENPKDYPEPPPGNPAYEGTVLDKAVDIYAASRVIAFREGFERGLDLFDYYEKFPERLMIARYVRKRNDASLKEICRFVDKQEERLVASLSSSPAMRYMRPCPLPWESEQLQQLKRLQARVPSTEQQWEKWVPLMKQLQARFLITQEKLANRMRWADALAKTKNEPKRVMHLRTFLCQQRARALDNKSAQMYFLWKAASKGQVIDPDGIRVWTFGDSWRHLQSIGVFDIPPQLERALREIEGANQGRGPGRGRRHKKTLGELMHL